jgi:Flp pilus assembly pilin Flp
MRRSRSERGATSLEYGLMAFLMAACLAFAIGAFGDANRASFEDSCRQLASATGTTC